MDYTSGANNVSGQFTDGDPEAGQAATTVEQVWLNGVNNELVGGIAATGQTPNAANNTQIQEMIRRLASSENQIFNAGLMLVRGGFWPSPGPGDSGAFLAAGWTFESNGITAGQISQNANGYIISGSGNIGSTFKLRANETSSTFQNSVANLGIAPIPEKLFTAAVRAGSYDTDASVAVTMEIDHNPDLETYLTIIDTGKTSVSIGGVATNSGMASVRYIAQNKGNQSLTPFPSGPEITFTLEATGTFKIRFGGCGLWEGNVPDTMIPSCIISDHVKDQAIYDVDYDDRYDQTTTYVGIGVVGDTSSVGNINTTMKIWVPLKKPMAFIPTFQETLISGVAGTVDGQTITAVNSAQITVGSTTDMGFEVVLNIVHDATVSSGLNICRVDFVARFSEGADFT